MAKQAIQFREIQSFRKGELRTRTDQLAVEEPVEIRLMYGPEKQRSWERIAVTMRTPFGEAAGRGPYPDVAACFEDIELALGFLFTEGIVSSLSDVERAAYDPLACAANERNNVVLIELKPGVDADIDRLKRNFYTSSSCGVCGKASIEAIESTGISNLAAGDGMFDALMICDLPAKIRPSQTIFDCTGGLHAAGLFTPTGELQLLREDVGRHNAVDKLIGAALLAGMLPLSESLIMVSGRASFELIQKSLMAGIPMLAAVGAPSSLAVSLADSYNMGLIGFVRDGRFNIYCGHERLRQ